MARRHQSSDAEDLLDFGDLLQPSEAAEPILGKGVRGALLEWLEEIWAEAELIAANLKPRKRAIFDGKPGTGKTTLAHHLSARLGLPMLVVRPERLIDSFVGSTGRNIGDLFDMVAKTGPVLMFMDEFDAVAIKRKAANHGAEEERNSWVNTLLQRIEQYDGYLIAATNFASHVDPAIWRRFDVHITLELPGHFERERILERYLKPWGLPKQPLRLLADSMETASPALMRQFVEALKRNLIIGPKVGWDLRRDQTIDRIVAGIQPHPEFGKPRLWSRGAADAAIAAMPWPLPKADEIDETAAPPSAPADTVVPFPAKASG